MAAKEELKLLLNNNRDNKGRRQLLLKNLDNVVAKHFESLCKNSGDGKVVVSVKKWLKDGVRELSFLSIVVRAPLIDLQHPFTCKNVLCPPPPFVFPLLLERRQ
jgi:hypothetical protein